MTEMPPIAPRKPVQLSLHNHTRIDDYYWLRERDNPDVMAYLNAENAYTQQMMAPTEPLQETLYQEMVARIQESDQTVPERIDDYYYYSRTEEGKEYRIYCRKHGSLDAPETVLLDLNDLTAAHDYVNLGVFKVSPDHSLLAYSRDTTGAETFTIQVKNLITGEHLPERIETTDYSLEWAADNRTFFYTTLDDARRSDKVWRHTVGTSAADDDMLFHERDQLFRVHLYKTKDRAYIVLLVHSLETSEAHVLRADQPRGTWSLVEPRELNVRYEVEHHSGHFYIVTNFEAPNFKLIKTPVATPQRTHWQTILPHREDVKVDGIDVFTRHIVAYERQNALRTIRVLDVRGDASHVVAFPDAIYTYTENRNPEFDTNLLRFTYQSLVMPESVYDYDMDELTLDLKKRQPVNDYDPQNYHTERIVATAPDGARVPISLVYRKDRVRIGSPAPCLLYGYGSYGYSIDPGFSSQRVSLLDRGLVWAIAHIRGGDDLGRAWYDQGKFLNKRNTFEDFIACARHLINKNVTSSEQLAIWGRSAGGLLIGAVLNMAPDLFHAAVAGVPFVDVVTTMLDESIPLTVAEFEEWGNPRNPDYYAYMLSYSPYDNVADRPYPHLLVTAGLNDPRVQYWEPAKWVSRLRRHWPAGKRLLLKTEMGAGHAGPSGRYEALRETAFIYAFIRDALDLAAETTPPKEADRVG